MFMVSPICSTQLLGSPDDSDLGFLRSDNARRYVKQLPHVPKKSFQQKFPNVSPLAMDLAQRMLVFDPSKRITGKPFVLPKTLLKKIDNIYLWLQLTNLPFNDMFL